MIVDGTPIHLVGPRYLGGGLCGHTLRGGGTYIVGSFNIKSPLHSKPLDERYRLVPSTINALPLDLGQTTPIGLTELPSNQLLLASALH